MRFTKAEFDVMVHDLLYADPICFDTLCEIAEKTLRPSVIRWCVQEDCLRGRGYEDDIMQDIYIRLIQTTVSHFLLRDGLEGPYNNDPEGFEDWMFRVANNLKRDFANKVRSRDFRTRCIDDVIGEGNQDEEFEDAQGRTEKLRQAFAIVLSADVSVYKVLTWLAQCVFMLVDDITKIESNQSIIEAFENKTLYEMYDMILTASAEIPWLYISKQEHERILDALRKTRDGDVSYGETKYRDFFMKCNGVVSGKKSISDWVHRVNGMIKKKEQQ